MVRRVVNLRNVNILLLTINSVIQMKRNEITMKYCYLNGAIDNLLKIKTRLKTKILDNR